MPVLHRQIRRLRLAATRDEHVRHGRILCEDALRTATIDDQGRLIIVRRLELGAVPAGAPAIVWSRRIETGLARLPGQLVRADSPPAARAAAVFFQSAEEPWLLLAIRAALGQALHEWFWPVALPGWDGQTSSRDNLRLAFRTLAARPHGLRHTLQLAQRLAAVRALPVLFLALEPGDLQGLAPALPAPASTAAGAGDEPLVQATGARRQLETDFSAYARIAAGWTPDDTRVHWMATCLAAVTTRAVPGHMLLLEPDRASVTAILVRLHDSPLPTKTAPRDKSQPNERAAGRPARRFEATPPATQVATRSPELWPDAPPGEQPLFADRQPTGAGGLFFMIHLLERVNLAQRLEQLPETQRFGFVAQVFHLALRHARIPTADPIRQFLAADRPDAAFDLRDSAYVFLLRAHREGRALCGLGLRQIIVRPALVTMTSTHADLFFRSKEADVRLRRAGLDLDPGWVRWLGRAVAFHYNRED